MRKYNGIFSALAAIVLPVVAASSAVAQIITVGASSDNGAFVCLPNRPCPAPCALRDPVHAFVTLSKLKKEKRS